MEQFKDKEWRGLWSRKFPQGPRGPREISAWLITCETRLADRPEAAFVFRSGSYESAVRRLDSRLPSNVRLIIHAVR